ncbi:hypothetical protein [Gibbsiella quercinecans]|uniref:hypothetical protein n=1 Tax=Gibbsiella quercinecans TaxID=929813 RepID=UPI001E37B400|nr:hypothetical protein [Gibbsiella quercinecans]
MSLFTQNTKWVLFLSDPNPDIRFWADLAFGVKCLEDAGVEHNNIFLYIDGPTEQVSSVVALCSTHPYTIRPSQEFLPTRLKIAMKMLSCLLLVTEV